MDALQKLIEAVEAGVEKPAFWKVWQPENEGGQLAYIADRAFSGSLDAAKALHDALLPGWEWGRAPDGMMWVHGSGSGIPPQWGNGIAARAWLLAVLRAYRQQMGGGLA